MPHEYNIKTFKQLYVFLIIMAAALFLVSVFFAVSAIFNAGSDNQTKAVLLFLSIIALGISIFTVFAFISVRKNGKNSRLLRNFLSGDKINKLK